MLVLNLPVFENKIRMLRFTSRQPWHIIILFITSQARARQLLKAGYKTLSSLAWADANLLVTQIEHLSRRQAHQIVSAAKVKPLYFNVWIT